MTFPHIENNTQVGPFRIEGLLSPDGNMSRLYIARHMSTGRQVALKIARSDHQVYTNFIQDEVAQLNKTHHPNIVHLYPIQLAPGKKVYIAKGSSLSRLFNGSAPWYYVMEMINGGAMTAHQNALLSFPQDWRVELLYQIALGVSHLHHREIAHRDLKPDNIIFRKVPSPSERPYPVIVDFGIASRYNEDPRTFAASMGYAAPEVVERVAGIRANYRTTKTATPNHLSADMWALGVMAYELFTGKHPFAPYRSEEELAQKILHSPPNPMSGVHESIKRIILGDPNSPDEPYGGFRWGMLSKVRDERPDIEDVLQHFDTQTPYLPPRY